jgi:hypothetical protein
MGKDELSRVGRRSRIRQSRQGEGSCRPWHRIAPGDRPLARMLLDADQVVVGEPMGLGMVVGLHEGTAVSPLHVQDRDRPRQHRQRGEEVERQGGSLEAVCRAHARVIRGPPSGQERLNPTLKYSTWLSMSSCGLSYGA